MEFLASEMAAACGGALAGPDRSVDGASADSRAIEPGQLFVAIRAERDGHEFVPAASAQGAQVALVEHPVLTGADTAPSAAGGMTEIIVDDTVAALAELGRLARGSLHAKVVGITGSVGKTSTKDLLAGIHQLAGPSFASEKSLNNELGVPFTLLGAAADAEHGVVEMGARGSGHIATLCGIAAPDIAVVTRVAAAHTELFGSLDAVADAKSELVAALASSGHAVLNADDPRVAAMSARTAAAVTTYGSDPDADVRIADLMLNAALQPSFDLVGPWGVERVQLAVAGAHNASNAAGAAAAAWVAGIGIPEIRAGLSTATLSPHRMDLQRSTAGGWVLNDAYNANPASMRAAVGALAELEADRRVAVLGLMGELGDDGVEQHRAIAELCRSLGIDLVAVGTDDYGAGVAQTVAEVIDTMPAPVPGVAVLVKASRSAGLEAIAEAWTTG